MSSATECNGAPVPSMKKYQTIAVFFLAGLVAGSGGGMASALRTIWAHAYWSAGMYGLIAEQVLRQLLLWMGVGSTVFVLCGLIVAQCERLRAPARCAVCAVYVGLLCAGLFFASQYLPAGSSARVVLFILIPCVLLCLSRTGQWLLQRKSPVVGAALVCLLVLLSTAVWSGLRTLTHNHAAPSVVLIVVDCLRPDHLGCYGYKRDTSPTIDALARVGRQYEQAYAPAPWTKPSVASLFTGLLPARHGQCNPDHTAPDELLLLAEVLRNAGYTNFFINGGNVFLKQEFNFAQGFQHYNYLPQGRKSAADVARVFLDRIGAVGSRPYFAYIHFMDAHAPYTVNAHNTRYAEKIISAFAPGRPETLLSLQREPEAPCNQDLALRQYFRDLYDGQIRYVDDAVRAMLGGLKLLGRLDNTLFIITADHGQEFWEHGSAEHGHSLYTELLHVPLIIAGSSVSSNRITKPVQLPDIMPTILDYAGVARAGLRLQGLSLMPGTNAAAEPRALYASATLYGPETWCVVQNNRKLIYRSRQKQGKWRLKGPQAPAGYQLFDLSRDPAEQDDRAATDGVPRGLEELLADYISTESVALPGPSILVGGDALRSQLESLGYIQ